MTMYATPETGELLDSLARRLHAVEMALTSPSAMKQNIGSTFETITIGPVGDRYTISSPSDPPTGLTVTTGTFFQEVYVDVSWTASATAVEYEVYVAKKNIAAGTYELQQIFRTAATNIRIKPLDPNSTYGIRVYALNRLSRSSTPLPSTGYTDIATGTDATIPAGVTGLTAGAGLRSVTISWNENTETDVKFGAGLYEVTLATDSGFTANVQSRRVSATIISFTNLSASTQYFYRVAPIDSSGNQGPWSSTGNVTTGQLATADIADLAIVSAKLADNAVTAAKILAGSVTTEKLTVGSVGDSAILNGGFEDVSSSDATRAQSWTYNYETSGSGHTYALPTAAADVRTGNRGLSITVPANVGAAVASKSIPVAEGEVWYISYWARSSVALTSGRYLRASFDYAEDSPRGASGQVIVDIGGSNLAWPSVWTKFDGQVTVPAGMRFMRIAPYAWTNASGYTAYVDDVTAQKVSVSASIADGAVTAAKIIAGSINSDHVVTAGLDATVIKFGTMSGDRITSNTLDANRIKTSSITAADITLNGGSFRSGNPPTTGLLINSQGISLYSSSTRTVFLDAVTGNGTFTGTISGSSISGTTITGGTITGGLYRSAASGERVELAALSNKSAISFWSARPGGDWSDGDLYVTYADSPARGQMVLRPPMPTSDASNPALVLESQAGNNSYFSAGFNQMYLGQAGAYFQIHAGTAETYATVNLHGNTTINGALTVNSGESNFNNHIVGGAGISARFQQLEDRGGGTGKLRCGSGYALSFVYDPGNGYLYCYINDSYIGGLDPA